MAERIWIILTRRCHQFTMNSIHQGQYFTKRCKMNTGPNCHHRTYLSDVGTSLLICTPFQELTAVAQLGGWNTTATKYYLWGNTFCMTKVKWKWKWIGVELNSLLHVMFKGKVHIVWSLRLRNNIIQLQGCVKYYNAATKLYQVLSIFCMAIWYESDILF